MTPAGAASTHRVGRFQEDAAILAQQELPAGEFIVKLHAPQCAAHATPGSLVQLRCDVALPMHRPLAIMRADPQRGRIDVLYSTTDGDLELLSRKRAGEHVTTLGPIGQGFTAHPQRPRALLIGDGSGIAPMVFLSETLKDRDDAKWRPLVFMGTELAFPFRARPSTILVPGMPDGCIGCMPLLDDWGIPSRLSTQAGLPGCYEGDVAELAAAWLATLDVDTLDEVAIFACGPLSMLAATAAMARRFGVPCQVSFETFVACASGSCADCTVQVQTRAGPVTKLVCVDGPVFDAAEIFAPR